MLSKSIRNMPVRQLKSTFCSIPAIHQSISGRSRFYKQVNVAPTASGDKFNITLDGRVLKTPARNPLELPNMELAMGIAAEWDAQTDTNRGIQPVNMPLMSLASTAIDQIELDPQTAINTCLKYLPTDSALFIAPEFDRILLAKQQQYLFPVIEWFKNDLKLPLQTTQSMAGRINHPDSVLMKIESILAEMDSFTLACLQGSVLESKSLVLSMAFIAGKIPLEDMIAASRLEEEFQVEIWGVVEGGHDMDRLNNAVRLSSVGTFLSLYHGQKQLEDQTKQWAN